MKPWELSEIRFLKRTLYIYFFLRTLVPPDTVQWPLELGAFFSSKYCLYPSSDPDKSERLQMFYKIYIEYCVKKNKKSIESLLPGNSLFFHSLVILHPSYTIGIAHSVWIGAHTQLPVLTNPKAFLCR